MAKTSIENLLEQHLQDLILPADKFVIDPLLLIGGAAILLLIFAGLIWRWNKHIKTPKQKAKRKLKKLQENPNDSSQATALQLSKILRDGLETPRLELFQPQDNKNWASFIKNIETACYSKETANIDLGSLFTQANYWLRLV
jgi:hypothetical protein